ncbi:DUF2283 domain-containing protein [Streptomyces sp. NPDC048504]|uniref:DUF2283 domain-containing protein n=1 Tax=Streptomyces sp. NPDC048504 TaxID=3365559 RepID=UPI00371B9C9D
MGKSIDSSINAVMEDVQAGYIARPKSAKGSTDMVDVRVTYDPVVNAAYVYFMEPQVTVPSAHTYPCDPIDVDGMINLDFDAEGRVIGIEILAADTKLPRYMLDRAERLERP